MSWYKLLLTHYSLSSSSFMYHYIGAYLANNTERVWTITISIEVMEGIENIHLMTAIVTQNIVHKCHASAKCNTG